MNNLSPAERHRLQVFAPLQSKMERFAELLDEQVLAKLVQLTGAKRTLVATYKGQITDTLEVDDPAVQLAAVREILALKAAYPAKQVDVTSNVRVEQLHAMAIELSQRPVEELIRLVDEAPAALPEATT